MMLIKLFLKKIYRNKISMFFRNLIGIKPAIFLINLNKKNISTSDAFFWRTDSGYSTIFKFSDLLSLYLNENLKEVEILFYDKFNNFLKSKTITNINLNNKLIIDSNFLNGLKDYGIFYIFHKSKNQINSIIRNSCYTGYSYKNSLPSFVHGNLVTSFKSFDGSFSEFGIMGASKFKKNRYMIQNYHNFDKTEIAIMNPTQNTLDININNRKIILESCNSKILDIGEEKTISIISKCYLLRPLIFNYENNFIDVYHG